MIPKTIYYTWFGPNPIPNQFQDYINRWSVILPDYQIIKINESNYIWSSYTDHCLKHNLFSTASNYERIMRLLTCGGLYLDIDVDVIKPFDELLNEKIFFGIQSPKIQTSEHYPLLNTAIMGAERGNKFLKLFIDQLNKMHSFEPVETSVFLVSSIAGQFGWNKRNESQRINDIMILDNRYFYPYYFTDKFDPHCITPETICVHHWGATWMNK